MLTAEEKEFYMTMEDLFDHPGWALLVQGWHNEAQLLPEQVFYDTKLDAATLAGARVRMQLLRELLDLPNILRQQRTERETELEQADDL